jgi:hypothetical protein
MRSIGMGSMESEATCWVAVAGIPGSSVIFDSVFAAVPAVIGVREARRVIPSFGWIPNIPVRCSGWDSKATAGGFIRPVLFRSVGES